MIRNPTKDFERWFAQELRSESPALPRLKVARASPELPESVDWRLHSPSVVSPVKSQGGCGSCWAFAAAETIATRRSERYGVSQGEPRSHPDGRALVSISSGQSLGAALAPFLATSLRFRKSFPEPVLRYSLNEKARRRLAKGRSLRSRF